MARMHVAASDFPLARPNALSVGAWRPLAEACGADADRVEPGLAAEIAGDLDALEQVWPSDLPTGVIHADLFPDNVFFLSGELSGLIDFYFACNDILAYDLAIGLCAWCFEQDGAFNVTKGRAMIEGYRAVRPLSDAEIAALPILARGAAMRFLLTRLYDWLNVPDDSFVTKKDPREYLRKLRFHRGVREAADYGIERSPA
jgi:homoserine kinase type II